MRDGSRCGALRAPQPGGGIKETRRPRDNDKEGESIVAIQYAEGLKSEPAGKLFSELFPPGKDKPQQGLASGSKTDFRRTKCSRTVSRQPRRRKTDRPLAKE